MIMKKVLLIVMLLGIAFQVAKPVPADNSAVTGKWKCAVADAPYEYTNSVITLAEKDGKLTGTVKFDSGEELKLSTAKYDAGKLVLTLYVEGYSVTVDGKLVNNKITGTVDTPDGRLNFTASKVVDKK